MKKSILLFFLICLFNSCSEKKETNEKSGLKKATSYVKIDLTKEENPLSKALNVFIDSNNNITIDDSNIDFEELESKILELIPTSKTIELYADVDSKYGAIIKIIDIAKNNQLKIALKTNE